MFNLMMKDIPNKKDDYLNYDDDDIISLISMNYC